MSGAALSSETGTSTASLRVDQPSAISTVDIRRLLSRRGGSFQLVHFAGNREDLAGKFAIVVGLFADGAALKGARIRYLCEALIEAIGFGTETLGKIACFFG